MSSLKSMNLFRSLELISFRHNFRWEADVTEAIKQMVAANKSGKAVPPEVQAVFQQETHISHNVTNFEFFYEPFYVANDLVPPHDERFLGYGFTRNTQVSLYSFYKHCI